MCRCEYPPMLTTITMRKPLLLKLDCDCTPHHLGIQEGYLFIFKLQSKLHPKSHGTSLTDFVSAYTSNCLRFAFFAFRSSCNYEWIHRSILVLLSMINWTMLACWPLNGESPCAYRLLHWISTLCEGILEKRIMNDLKTTTVSNKQNNQQREPTRAVRIQDGKQNPIWYRKISQNTK